MSETVSGRGGYYPLSNRPNPALSILYFYLTEGCNLACKHCWVNPPYDETGTRFAALSRDRFERAINEAIPLGLQAVKLTGGEPMLHPEVRYFLRSLISHQLNVLIETNGTLIDDEIAVLLRDLKECFISISIDSTGPEIHDRIRSIKGAHGKAVDGIRRLVAHDIAPQVIASLLPENKKEIPQIIRFAENLGASSFKLNIIQPTARGEQLKKQGHYLDVDEILSISEYIHKEVHPVSSIPVFVSVPYAFRPLHVIARSDMGRCGIMTILGVLATGEYALCGIGTSVPELIFGRIDDGNLKEIWSSHPVLKSLRDSIPDSFDGVCSECVMNTLCLGSCIAQNYYASRTLTASHWFCSRAAELNLFPESRRLKKKRRNPAATP